ncbi:MAG: serine/threonine-protein kinase [Planctomycetota bacterium]|jgi:serine/threonine-protein kinase
MSSPKSILARIGGPRVRLREEKGGSAVEAIDLPHSGRYEVLGRIAAGGIGEVLKAHDGDLGRDVAVKMLRATHADTVGVVRRFVEEAQIGGQLQHPGIVPVYELGLHAEKRPYFAMKLIKGRSLGALLHERRDPAERRHRHLAVFLQVCETMAYAHSRGVIHRDLSPTNVLVGAFGEVQVVDWGLATVIARGGVADERRAKQTATDMTRIATARTDDEVPPPLSRAEVGTPAYMAPEQALGRVEDLDERADVFSLGAILCEILTGKPAYVAAPDRILQRAAEGRIEPAFARLDRCGRDPVLVGLAKSCLAPLRQDRPRDAAELTVPIARHLAAVDERAQKSKLAAIEARRHAAEKHAEVVEEKARAEEARNQAAKARANAEEVQLKAEAAAEEAASQRRAHRLTLAVAGAILLVVAAGAAGYAWVADARAENERRAAAEVRPVLEEARLLKGESKWDEALRVARHAIDLATEGPADDQTQAEARALHDGVLAEKEEGERTAAENKRRRGFVATLEEIRLRYGEAFDPEETEAAFAQAFREFGLDLDALEANDAADRIRSLGDLAPRVAAVLDDWAWLRHEYLRRKTDVSKPKAVANALDDDPGRRRLRVALGRNAPEVGHPADLPPQTIALRGLALLSGSAAEAGVSFLREAHLHHPADAFINARLAMALTKLVPPQRSESLRHLAAARVAYPRSEALRAAMRCAAKDTNDLDGFRDHLGYQDPKRWFSVVLRRSLITGQRKRIYFNKRWVTTALLNHEGGEEWTAAPMNYPPGTAFVAEEIDAKGKIVSTECLRIREERPPEFFLFDSGGKLMDTFTRKQGVPRHLVVPRNCFSCHTGNRYYDPMQSFPEEPQHFKVELDERYRDLKIVVKFYEGYHRGSRVFGPYGAIWMGKLKGDAKAGQLAEEDRPYYAALKKKYPELMGE